MQQEKSNRLKSKIKRLNNTTIKVDNHCLIKYDGIWKTLFVARDMTGNQWMDFFEFLHKEIRYKKEIESQKAVDKLLKELGITKSN
jgi:hypothetical protein